MAPATHSPLLPLQRGPAWIAGPTLPGKKRPKPASELRVLKKLAPNARGAKGLSLQFGDQLVCVRHRLDSTGTRRLVTVELIIDEKAIRRRPGPTVDIALRPHERALKDKLKAAGAKWHSADAVWSIRRSIAMALGLRERIVPRRP